MKRNRMTCRWLRLAHRATRPWRGLALAIAAAVWATTACSRPATDQPRTVSADATAVPVGVEPAAMATMRAVIPASGIVVPATGADFIVIAPEPARIVELPHAAGDPVASGDLLVRYEIPGVTREVERQRAEVARAEALVENARATRDRSAELFARGIISRRELDDATAAVTAAQTEADRATRALDAAVSAADRLEVVAPFAGVVINRLHEPGDVVQAAVTDPVLRVVDPSRLEAMVTIDASDAPRVLPGATARLTSPLTPTPVRLRVAAPPQTGPGGGSVRIRLVFEGPMLLAVETPIDVEIDGEERVDAVVVPAEALVRMDGGAFVMVAAGGRAEQRAVTTGFADATRVELLSGVRAGELIITRGQIGLADGAAISVDR